MRRRGGSSLGSVKGIVRGLIGRGAIVQMAKVGGGVVAYNMVSTQVDAEWVRWAIYAGLAVFGGVYAPLAIAGLNRIWPAWVNLDVNPTIGPNTNPPLITAP